MQHVRNTCILMQRIAEKKLLYRRTKVEKYVKARTKVEIQILLKRFSGDLLHLNFAENSFWVI